MFKSIRIILAIVVFYDYKIWQMDVKTVFLNGDLEEDVYMTRHRVLRIQRMLRKYASFSDPFMD